MISISDIDRWNVADIEAVFSVCADQADHCSTQSANLKNLDTFSTWDGDAAAAAKRSVGRTRVDFDVHGNQVSAIANAARAAAQKIEAIKEALAKIRADAFLDHFAIDDGGTVRSILQTVISKEDMEKREGNRIALQLRVNQLLINAEAADDDLAAAIRAADGELKPELIPPSAFDGTYAGVFGIASLGLPNYPDASLTDAETRNYYAEAEKRLKVLNDTLAKSDMPTEQRALIAQELRNEIRTKARTLMADQARAAELFRAEPNKTMEQLVEHKSQKYGMTREQALEDIIRSSSTSRGSVNTSLGVDPEKPVLPDLKEVESRSSPRAGPVDVAPERFGGTATRMAAKVALPAALAFEVYNGYNQVSTGEASVPEATGSGIGAVGGAWAGAEYGAMAGTFGGPVGIGIGVVVGGLAGGIIGGSFGKQIGGLFD
ncbi:phage head morphogenesis protein [Gordonia westfalica]|uniref:Phage head morphogenesis protein n=1 Tax=Gordonia westfalica TaxID=158898 RepID=A0ABU2GTV7_9ACTN|nr:phage head morphogenesis protein [Gordonia westfalica]MDS1114894.1 phage head morphogenesis protein [Gordonia westfalica]